MDTSLTEALIEMINKGFNGMETIESAMAGWLAAAKLIGCIAAYIYVAKTYAAKTVTGEQFNPSDFTKPIVIALFLSVYPSFSKGIELLFVGKDAIVMSSSAKNLLTLQEKQEKQNQENKVKEQEKISKALTVNEDETQQAKDYASKYVKPEDSGPLSDIMGGLKTSVDYIIDMPGKAFEWFVSKLMNVFFAATIGGIYLIAKMYITVLYILGPFSIAMTLMPGFENSFANWAQNYIKYSLWVPIANTIALILSEMQLAAGMYVAVPGIGWTVQIVMIILGIISFLCIPKMAASVLAFGNNQSSTKQMVNQAVQQTMSKAVMTGAGAATGGAATAATAVTSLVKK